MEAMPSRHIYRWLLIIATAAGVLAGCGQMRPIGSHSDLIAHVVQPGDTLYSISWRYGYDHREVAAWNSISPPYTIYVGQQVLIIPPYQATPREAPRRSPTHVAKSSAKTSAAVSQAAVIDRSPSPSAIKKLRKPETRNERRPNTKIDWRWPVKGALRSTFGPNAGRKGLDIAGKLGQPVLAAAGGKVVYSGNGLIGYGNLVIIKHDAHYLSAYGHNRRLLVKEGSEVKQGQKIAEMGDSGKEGVVLHFEIRRDGKPVNPLRYLPRHDS